MTSLIYNPHTVEYEGCEDCCSQFGTSICSLFPNGIATIWETAISVTPVSTCRPYCSDVSQVATFSFQDNISQPQAGTSVCNPIQTTIPCTLSPRNDTIVCVPRVCRGHSISMCIGINHVRITIWQPFIGAVGRCRFSLFVTWYINTNNFDPFGSNTLSLGCLNSNLDCNVSNSITLEPLPLTDLPIGSCPIYP